MQRTPTKVSESSFKKYEDQLLNAQQTSSSTSQAKSLTAPSPKVSSPYSVPTLTSPLKGSNANFYTHKMAAQNKSQSQNPSSNDTSSKLSIEDARASPRYANFSGSKKSEVKNINVQPKLKSISEASYDHGLSLRLIASNPTNGGDADRSAALGTIERERLTEPREESEKDSVSQSKVSIEPRIPVKKISIVNASPELREHKESRSGRSSPLAKAKTDIVVPHSATNKSIPIIGTRDSRELVTPTKFNFKMDKEEKEKRETTSLVLDASNKQKKTAPSTFNVVNNVNVNPPSSNRGGRKDNQTPVNRSSSNQRDRKKLFSETYLKSNTSPIDSPGRYMRLSQRGQSYLRQSTSSSVESRNIKVVARFRPYNKVESELFTNGLGSECMVFPEEKSVIILPENSYWTFDYVFRPESLQEDVYSFIGKETVTDVLAGYNGTIFAYGQTSSGKTFTMYGDIHDDEMKGIIPRVSDQIFTYIQNEDDEVEFVVNCSMVEIYKETLYDLLNDRANDLKIKENPRKGIYVDGLNEISICSPEEMMEVLEIGERSRTIAATRMNQHSSRSHTLFMMEIVQRFPNRSEKRGRLNLIDLAGSEKVGKSGATGETLEEAKKINLSLSCLGNVIHSLTTNCDHIPYRDSKLTRILQESLSGNYKTSLIVTCSPHSSNREETISTLKFATRAKTIKTHYKMNIENSPEALHGVIERLKLELSDAHTQIQRFKTGDFFMEEGVDFGQDLKKFSSFKPPDFAWKNKSPSKEQKTTESTGGDVERRNINLTNESRSIEKGERPIISRTSFRQLLGDESRSPAKRLRSSSSAVENFEKSATVQKHYNDYTYFKSNLELINENQNWSKKIEKLNETMELYRQMLHDKDQIIKNQEEQILNHKNELLQNEKKIDQLMEQQDKATVQAAKHLNDFKYHNERVLVMEKQIEGLADALANCEQSIENLLKEKNRLITNKFDEMLRQDAEFKSIRLSDYFASSFNFHYEPFYAQLKESESRNESYSVLDEKNSQPEHDETKSQMRESFINQLDIQKAFNNALKLASPLSLPLSATSVLLNSPYGNAVQNNTTDKSISPQLVIYLLQQQLLQSAVVNKQFERIINTLEWKQIIEYGKAKITARLCQMQEHYIHNIENILEKAAISHQRLRDRVEAIEDRSIKMKETMVIQADNIRRLSVLGGATSKAKVLRKVNREFTKKQLKRTSEDAITPGPNGEIDTEMGSARDATTRHKGSMHGMYKGESMSSIHENFTTLAREVERDSSFAHKSPDSLEEAKTMIIAKNQTIDKLKKILASHNINPVGVNQSITEFGANTSQYEVDYLRSENERLQDKFLILQTEYDLERMKSEQLKDAYFETKKQNESFQYLNQEIEIASRKVFKTENESWQKIIDEYRLTNETEILRKQEEANKLHDILAKWIYKYMDLQEQKGSRPSQQENILYETYKRKEIPQSSLLYRALESSASKVSVGLSSPDKDRLVSPRFSKRTSEFTPKKI